MSIRNQRETESPAEASITEREGMGEAATEFVADVTDDIPIRYIRYPSAANAYATARSIVIARPSAQAASVTEAMLYPNTNALKHDFI